MTIKKIYFLLIPFITCSQVKLPVAPQTTQIPNYNYQNYSNQNNKVTPSNSTIFLDVDKQKQQKQYEQIMQEVQQYEKQKLEAQNQLKKDLNELNSESDGINYNLPSFSNIKGTENYRNVYDKMLTLNIDNYSVKDLNFEIENL